MTYAKRSLKLYLANRSNVLGVPIMILGLVVLLTILIAIAVGVAIGFPVTEHNNGEPIYNMGAMFSIPGFLVSLGVVATNRNFAMALAFGSTRRDFWLGTAAGFAVTSAVTGLGAVLLMVVENLTGGYWLGAIAFNMPLLGDGNYLICFTVIFLTSMASLFIGAAFGTIYRAFGARTTTLTAIGVSIALFLLIIVITWQRAVIVPWFVENGAWSIVWIMAGLVAIGAVCSRIANRVAIV